MQKNRVNRGGKFQRVKAARRTSGLRPHASSLSYTFDSALIDQDRLSVFGYFFFVVVLTSLLWEEVAKLTLLEGVALSRGGYLYLLYVCLFWAFWFYFVLFFVASSCYVWDLWPKLKLKTILIIQILDDRPV